MSEVHPLIVVNHRLLGAHIDVDSQVAHAMQWEISYGEKLVDEDENLRYVMGWLHGATEELVLTVTVGALLQDTGVPYDDANIEEILTDSYVVHDLYGRARDVASVMLGLSEESIDLPHFLDVSKVEPFSAGPSDDDAHNEIPSD